MADPTLTSPAAGTALSPLHGWSQTFAALAPAVTLAETPVAQVIIRTTDPEVIAQLSLPAACESRTDGIEVALWLGPDEWLLYRPGVAGHDYLAELTARAGITADSSTQGTTYLLDTTGQRTRLVLGGEYAATILAHGLSIDLAPDSFGPDDAVQTLLAQTGVILHRLPTPETGFALLVRSSFADYLAHWLVDASLEYRSQ